MADEEDEEVVSTIVVTDPSLCTVEDPPRWNCVVCDKKIHGGDECPCSGYREKDFNFASLCAHCCEIYDRLMGDKELQAVLKHMFRKYYFEGRGSIIDF